MTKKLKLIKFYISTNAHVINLAFKQLFHYNKSNFNFELLNIFVAKQKLNFKFLNKNNLNLKN